jgi:hypothetical protein
MIETAISVEAEKGNQSLDPILGAAGMICKLRLNNLAQTA